MILGAGFWKCHISYSKFYKKTIISRGPPVRASRNPRGPRTPVWEPLTYVIDNHCLYVSALFDGMCKDIGSERYKLLIYKLRWLSKSKVLSRVFKLSHQLRRLLFITLIVDPTWCSKLACYVDIVEFQYAMQRLTGCSF